MPEFKKSKPSIKRKSRVKIAGKRKTITKSAVAKIAKSVIHKTEPRKMKRWFQLGSLHNGAGASANAYVWYDLSDIDQGTGFYRRESDRVYISGLTLHHAVVQNRSVTYPRYMRFIVLAEKAVSNLTDIRYLDTGTWSNLFMDVNENPRASDTHIGDITSNINTNLYKVYADKTYSLATASTTRDDNVHVNNLYLPIKRYQQYRKQSQTGGTDGTRPSNGRLILVCLMADFATNNSTDIVFFEQNMTVYFKDA